MLNNILFAALGGAVGSALRMGISLLFAGINPFATLIVNVMGSFAIGVAVANIKPSALYYFVIIGLCGGFTTFSTFSLEVLRLLKSGNILYGISYILLSVILCVVAVAIGSKIAIGSSSL